MKNTFIIPSSIFLGLIILNLVAIIILNSSHFTYIIDDSYIHLALAENISRFHYGVNANEYSSPSSSILWPFILAPFSGIAIGYYLPLIINILSSLGILFVFRKVITFIFTDKIHYSRKTEKIVILFLIFTVIAANMVVLTFGGMEHSLQTFFTVLIVCGLINETRQGKIPGWFASAVITAPLIRYENLALSAAAIVYMYFAGYKKTALLSFAFIVLLIGSFSVFLLSLGLEPLPMSVIYKSSAFNTGGSLYAVLENFKENLLSPRCALLIIGMIFLIYSTIKNNRNKKERFLAGCIAFAILMHMLLSKDGRYVVYIWTASILMFLFLHREWLVKTIMKNSFLKTAAIASAIVIILTYKYVYGIFTVSIASNNIYEQQYQMHRFAVEFYKRPVAVNDLGYAAYKNDNYVLDLAGLGSLEVLKYKRANEQQDWMDTLSKKHNIKFAMIYDSWFPEIPSDWLKIGELHLGKEKIAPAESFVSFYVLDQNLKDEVYFLIYEFQKTLPEGVKFITLQ